MPCVAVAARQVMRKSTDNESARTLEEYEKRDLAELNHRLRCSSCASPYIFPESESELSEHQRHISMLRCSIEKQSNLSLTTVSQSGIGLLVF